MYGSRKPDKSAYLASVCINSELKPQSVEKALAMGYESRRDGDPRSVADWGVIANLPRILSVKSRGREQWYAARPHLVPKPDPFAPEVKPKFKQPREHDLPREEPSERLRRCKQIMPLLSVTRADQYETWKRVCFALAYELGEHGRDMWIAFSKRSDKYDEYATEDLWEKAVEDEQSDKACILGTLTYFANEDNPGKYAALHKQKQKAV